MILVHDLIIILDRINTLKSNGAGGSLEVLRGQAIYTDQWLQENHENESIPLPQREAAHEWLQGVQEKLGAMVGTVGDFVNECPV